MPEIVVVGVGRSATARAALTWAADVAFRDPAPLRAVHAITPAGASARSRRDDRADSTDRAVISHRSRDSTSTTQP